MYALLTKDYIDTHVRRQHDASTGAVLNIIVGLLCISPSRAEFTEAIIGAINDLPQLLCDVSYGIDAEYLINDRVDTMRPETR